MADIWMDVNTALSEVPVNVMPLLDDSDFKTVKTAVAYNASGMTLKWNFVTADGSYTQTAVTPTTSGTYDWAHQGGGMYSIEIPASGGASINNDTEGYGWFSGVATGVLPWRGPVIGFTVSPDLYHADIQFCRDQANTQDEWTTTFFKNGVRLTSGITSPTLQLIKRVDGTDLQAATAMAQVGTTGSYKKDLTSTARVTVGEAVIAVVAFTAGGSARAFSKLIGRDSS